MKDIRMGDYVPLIRQDKTMWGIFAKPDEYGQPHATRQFYNTMNDYPSVSRYLFKHGYSVEYPNGSPFAICLTHDIDDMYVPMSHVWKMMRDGEFKDVLGIRGAYRNFVSILNLEERYGATSTFFFLATDSDPVRFRYRIEDIATDMGTIIDMGGEIGLHGGFSAHSSMEEICNQKQRLEKVIGKKAMGYRNHYLRFSIPDTWGYLEGAGFKYDSTMGYNHEVGFRNGMVHPFHPFNLKMDRPFGIIEVPLVAMERAFINRSDSAENACAKMECVMKEVEKYRGVLTVNWHNISFYGSAGDMWGKVYEKILAHGKKRNAWITNAGEIARFWNREVS